MPKKNDLTGQRFGRLTILQTTGKDKHGNYLWLARCDCGNEATVISTAIKSGRTRSCGCLLLERVTKHGECSKIKGTTREYKAWAGMKCRCFYKKAPNYKNYGARGIKICDNWMDFKNFLKDMGRCPPGLTIERKDNNGDYSPENCIWASAGVQARNRRTNRLLSKGKVTMCLQDWSELLNIPATTLIRKIKMLEFTEIRTL